MAYQIRFDKLKIITEISNIRSINSRLFTKNVRNGRIASWTYNGNSPYNLMIQKNREKQELIIEFTGKILLDKYPDLIGLDNIRLCLENINNLNICTLNTDGILCKSYITKCDVAIDVPYDQLGRLYRCLTENINNHKKYMCKQIGNNLEITNCVKTKNLKSRMIIYDKSKEIGKPENKEFLNFITNKDELLNYYKGKVRFELNLNSMQLIRNYLGIDNTSINSVLNSTNNPFMHFFTKILINETYETSTIENLCDYEHWLLIESCQHDLRKVEAVVRRYTSPKASVKQRMAPYHRLLQSSDTGAIRVHDELKNILT